MPKSEPVKVKVDNIMYSAVCNVIPDRLENASLPPIAFRTLFMSSTTFGSGPRLTWALSFARNADEKRRYDSAQTHNRVNEGDIAT